MESRPSRGREASTRIDVDPVAGILPGHVALNENVRSSAPGIEAGVLEGGHLGVGLAN